MKTRIVFCRSNPIAPDPRVTKSARALSDAGFDVKLIGWQRSGESVNDDYVEGLRRQSLSIKAPYGRGLFNLWGLLRWQWGLLQWLYANRADFDIIHACDFDTVLPAQICKWLFGKRVVYDIFDFYADHLRATPNWIKSLIRAVDLKIINWVDALIIADDSRWEQIAGSNPLLSAVIYNTPVDQMQTTEVELAPEQPEVLRVVYVGLMQIERGLLDLISLLSNHPTWHLDLAGFGGDQE
ncbi:MAG: glycosyltransferase, partial [Chloroflexota bacterium]